MTGRLSDPEYLAWKRRFMESDSFRRLAEKVVAKVDAMREARRE